MLFFVKKNKWV